MLKFEGAGMSRLSDDQTRFRDGTRVYVVGSAGMLGSALQRQIGGRMAFNAVDIVHQDSWVDYCDVRNYAQLRESVMAFLPDILINLAAITDLEACERDPDIAWQTNAMGVENAGLIASELKIPYVYISSAGIFSGQEYYTDYDKPRPLGVYARSKAYGEQWTQTTVARHYVFRAGWMMGGGPRRDKKFINKLYHQILGGSTEIFAVNDKFGCPTFTVDFAAGMERVISLGRYGTYNQVCKGFATRYDVAVAFVSALGLASEIKVTPALSTEFDEEYFAPRPESEQLINAKLDALGLNTMRHWRTCLEEYAEEYKRSVER